MLSNYAVSRQFVTDLTYIALQSVIIVFVEEGEGDIRMATMSAARFSG